MKINCRLIATICCLFISLQLYSQDSTVLNNKLTLQYAGKAGAKAEELNQKLDKKSQKALQQFQKQEAKMKRKLMKIDSLAANNVFANADKKYKDLAQRLNGSQAGQFIPKIDTLITSLKFLEQHPQWLSQAKEVKEKVKDALGKVNGLKDQFQKAEEIKKFLKERRQLLKEGLSKFGFAKELKKINKEVYYYAQQVNEYKEVLKDSKKAERKAIELLSKTKLFKDFMRKNSVLSSLFPMPTNDMNGLTAQTGFAGLQTRSNVLSFIQGQGGANMPGSVPVLKNNIHTGQMIVDQLRSKLAGFNGEDMEMPDFKPNSQKTKRFKKRLEIGSNLQSQKANYFFPSTVDFGFSIGYKPNDKSVIGIGTSFKTTWGKTIRHIRMRGEGLSLRSFIDIKVRKNFYATGGFEYNYQQSFDDIRHLYNISAWKKSCLLGVTKLVSVKGNFFKKMKVQLLYDFFYKERLPVTEPLKFRVGYVF